MNSKVFNIDCMIGMKEFPDNYFDLAVVDPPYGIGEDASRNNLGDRPTKKWQRPNSQKYKPFNDTLPPNKKYFNELQRVSKNQIIWGGNNFNLPSSTGWIVWDKKVDIKEHLSMCELAWSSFNIKCNKFEYLWAGFKKEEQIKRIHPTQKPVKLYEWIFKNYAEVGQKILDTHLGSGSSRIAAYNYKMDFTGYEIDKDYFEAAEKRFQNHIAQLKLFS